MKNYFLLIFILFFVIGCAPHPVPFFPPIRVDILIFLLFVAGVIYVFFKKFEILNLKFDNLTKKVEELEKEIKSFKKDK